MKPYFYISVIPLLLLASCNGVQQIEMQQIEIDQLYILDLPDNLTPSYDMHDYASLQYNDPKRGIYLLGIEDAKDNFPGFKRGQLKLPAYYQFVENSVLVNADTTAVLDQKEFMAGPHPAIMSDSYAQVDFRGNVHELFYRIVVYESKMYYFQLVIWMPYDTYCDQLPLFDQMLYSFRIRERQPSSKS